MTADPYAAVMTEPAEWVTDEPGLADAVAAWTGLPRDADRIVGSLHRPSLHHVRGMVRTSSRLAAVNARWLGRLPSTVGRRPWRDALADYAIDATASSGPGGRSLLGLIDGLRPSALVTSTGGVAPTPMSVDLVHRRLPATTRARLAELDDTPTAVSEYDQVHRGRLDDGRSVAVAISRPGTAGQLRESASLLAPWLVAVELADRSPWQHGLVEVLRDVVATGQRRCDQRAVALDAVVLQSVLDRSDITDVVVARPIPALVERQSAVYHLPADVAGAAPASELLAAGMSAIVEAGLVHGVFATHLDRGYVWGGAGTACHVGGVTLAPLSARSRRAIVSLLEGTVDPVDALVALRTTPAFVDRDSAAELLAAGGLTDPVAMLAPDAGANAVTALRELVVRHGTRPTPELTGFGLALARLVTALRTADGTTDATTLALRALPRLAGIGARMSHDAA